MDNSIRNLRVIGLVEGVSFLVLLLIAMPVKYLLGVPELVKVVGWAHGVLFMAYIVAVFLAIRAMQWNFLWVMIALGASLIPVGTFLLDSRLKQRQNELKEKSPGVHQDF